MTGQKDSVKPPDVSLGQKAVGGGLAVAFTQFGGTFINLLATMFLARLVLTEDFGLLAKVMAVTGVVGLIGDLGLSLATIQSKIINQKQLSAFFWINVAVAATLACLLIGTSYFVVKFYDDPRVYNVVFAMAFNLLVKGLGVQHQAVLTRQMRFRKIAVATVWSQLIAAVIAVLFAWYGWQYWALLIQIVCQTLIRTTLLWKFSGFLPGVHLLGTGIREQLKMGGSFTASNFVNYFARNADNIVIAKYWGETAVALYAKSYGLLLLPLRKLAGPMAQVAIPALSKLQDKPAEFRNFFKKGFRFALYLQTPITVFTAFAGSEIILCFLGPNWIAAVPIFYALIPNLIASTTSPVTSWIVLSTGDTARYFKVVLLNSIVLIAIFLLAAPYGVLAMAWIFSITTALIRAPVILYAIKPSPVNAKDVFPLLFRPMCHAILASIPIIPFFFLDHGLSHWIMLPLKGCLFFAAYAWLTKQTDSAQILGREIGKRVDLRSFRFAAVDKN